jgi:hypothetical protein
MNYLAQGLQSGFSLGFNATQNHKERKERKKERAEDVEFRKARAQIEDEFRDAQLANRGAEFAARQRLEDERLRMDAERLAHAKDADARDFGFRRDRAATSDLAQTRAEARQARLDFSAEIEKARTDPFREQILAEQARELQLRNDALADPKPKPVQPMETITYDPRFGDEPVRRITGPVGSLGSFLESSPASTVNYPTPPPEAVEYLMRDPKSLVAAFEEKYGPGSAARYLR